MTGLWWGGLKRLSFNLPCHRRRSVSCERGPRLIMRSPLAPYGGEGAGVRGSRRSCALLRAMKACATRTQRSSVKACITRFCECKALTPVPSSKRRGEFPQPVIPAAAKAESGDLIGLCGMRSGTRLTPSGITISLPLNYPRSCATYANARGASACGGLWLRFGGCVRGLR